MKYHQFRSDSETGCNLVGLSAGLPAPKATVILSRAALNLGVRAGGALVPHDACNFARNLTGLYGGLILAVSARFSISGGYGIRNPNRSD